MRAESMNPIVIASSVLHSPAARALRERTIMKTRFAKIAFLLPCALLVVSSSRAGDDGAVEKLIRDLQADKPAVRTHAAAELARIGPEAAEAVPALIEALDSDSLALKNEVLSALEHIGPSARAAVPALADLLKAKDSRLFMPAANALGSIGHDSAAATPHLAEFLTSADERIAVTAAYALARILPGDATELATAVPVLVKALHSKHRLIQGEATRGLMLIGPAAVPQLAELVGNFAQDPQSAASAAATLRSMGPAAYPALPALIQALASRHDLVVTHAADAIGAIGPTAKDSLSELQKLLASEHPLLRTHAAHNVGRLGPAAAPAIGDLEKLLQDKDMNVRREAAQALGQIGRSAKSAVPGLIAALKDEAQPVVIAAAHALARMGSEAVSALVPLVKDRQLGRWAVVILSEAGPAAAPAVSALRSALGKADDDFAKDILVAFGRIGPEAAEAVPDLIKIVADKDSSLRVLAAFALGNIGAAEAVPVLEEALEEKDENETKLSLVAAGALVLIEAPKGKDYIAVALPYLIAGLNDKSDSIRREAAQALRQIGPRASSAVPALLAGLKDPNPAVCADCLWALTAVAPRGTAATIVPELVPLLSSPSAQLRYTACYAAGSLGHEAVAAVPVLEKHLQDPDQFLQFAAAWALVRIGSDKPEIAEECIDPLIRGLALPDPQVRMEAATTLGMSGPLSQRAVPTLTDLTHDADKSVRRAAVDALKAIHGEPTENRKPVRQQTRGLRQAK